MSDPAIELAARRAQGNENTGMDLPDPARWGGARGAGDTHGDGNINQIAVPRGRPIANRDTDFGGLPYDGGQEGSWKPREDKWEDLGAMPDRGRKRVEDLTPEERDQVLRDYYARGEDTTQARRDIQLELDKEELDKKRKMTKLLFTAAKWFMIVALFVFLVLIAGFLWISVKSGTFSDTSIMSSILSTFAEIFKVIAGSSF